MNNVRVEERAPARRVVRERRSAIQRGPSRTGLRLVSKVYNRIRPEQVTQHAM
jgi:hypothetical protein